MAPVISHRLAERPVDTVTLPSAKITYRDVFSLGYLYVLMREWLVDNGYVGRDESKFPEGFHLQRESSKGTEVQIMWRLEKEVGAKPSIWKLAMDIDIHVFGMKQVEVLVKGKKVKARPFVIIDYSVWEKQNPLLKYAKRFLIKKFYKSERESYEGEILDDSFSLQGAIKAYLRLETFGTAGPGREVWQKRPG
jgi:hypothetical protein